MNKLSKILLTGALALGLVGCGSREKEKTKITFWHAMNGEQEKALNVLIDKFEKENPKIDVVLQNQSNYKDLQNKLVNTMQSKNDLPNISQGYAVWFDMAIQDNLLIDLSSKVNQSSYKKEFIESDKFNGKLYAVPFAKSTEVLFYNKEIVDKLGLKIPKTYEEYKKFSQTITKKTGIVGGGFDNIANYYQTYVYDKTKKLIDKDWDYNSKISRETINYLKNGIDEGYFKIPGADKYLSGLFSSKKVASFIGTNAGRSYVEKGANFEWKMVKAPYEKSIAQGTDLVVFNKNKEQNEASVKLINFLTSVDNQNYWCDKTGYIPVSEGSKTKDKVLNEVVTYPVPLDAKRNQLYNEGYVFMEKALSDDVDAAIEYIGKKQKDIFGE